MWILEIESGEWSESNGMLSPFFDVIWPSAWRLNQLMTNILLFRMGMHVHGNHHQLL